MCQWLKCISGKNGKNVHMVEMFILPKAPKTQFLLPTIKKGSLMMPIFWQIKGKVGDTIMGINHCNTGHHEGLCPNLICRMFVCLFVRGRKPAGGFTICRKAHCLSIFAH